MQDSGISFEEKQQTQTMKSVCCSNKPHIILSTIYRRYHPTKNLPFYVIISICFRSDHVTWRFAYFWD